MVYIQFPIEDSGFWNLLPVEKKSEGREYNSSGGIRKSAVTISGRFRIGFERVNSG